MQATLPLRFGGLGLRSALESSSAAFLGSCNASRDLVQRLLEAGSSRNVSTLDSMNLYTTESSLTLTLQGEIREKRFSVQLENHIDTDEPTIFYFTAKGTTVAAGCHSVSVSQGHEQCERQSNA